MLVKSQDLAAEIYTTKLSKHYVRGAMWHWYDRPMFCKSSARAQCM